MPILSNAGPFQWHWQHLTMKYLAIFIHSTIHLHITFFHQLIFNTPQLTQFISCTPKLKIPLKLPDAVCIVFSKLSIHVVLQGAMSKAPTIYYTILYIYSYSIYIYSICIDQLRGFAYTVYIWFIWFIH